MVYITGDTHGDYSRFTSPAARRLKKGDTLIVCGDFGFLWDGGKKERALLKKIARLPYTVLFLDGRHENYDLLKEYPIVEWNGGKAQAIGENLLHLLRGELYTIEYETYFVFGGGETPDPNLRTDAKTWWEEEMPTGEEMLAGRRRLEEAGNRVDFILTHEPSGKARGYMSGKGDRIDGVNIYLNTIEDSVEFGRWFFGCLHLDKPMSKRHLAFFRELVPVHEKTGTRR